MENVMTTRRDFLKLAGAAMVGATGVASAAENPFGFKEMDSGYTQIAEGKCGEGKCGGKKPEATCGGKSAEGSCGGKKAEGSCGSKKMEGTCGGKKPEAKCGEGKCGGNS